MTINKTTPLERIGTKLTDGGPDHLWTFHVANFNTLAGARNSCYFYVEVVSFTLEGAIRVFREKYKDLWIDCIFHHRVGESENSLKIRKQRKSNG